MPGVLRSESARPILLDRSGGGHQAPSRRTNGARTQNPQPGVTQNAWSSTRGRRSPPWLIGSRVGPLTSTSPDSNPRRPNVRDHRQSVEVEFCSSASDGFEQLLLGLQIECTSACTTWADRTAVHPLRCFSRTPPPFTGHSGCPSRLVGSTQSSRSGCFVQPIRLGLPSDRPLIADSDCQR